MTEGTFAAGLMLDRIESGEFPAEHLEPEDLLPLLQSEDREVRMRGSLLLGQLKKVSSRGRAPNNAGPTL